MTNSTGDPHSHDDAALSASERDELIRLRAQAEQSTTGGRRRPRLSWRPVVSAIAITLGCLLAPVAVASAWVQSVVVDTDRYVETMAPLAAEPAVQSLVSDTISDQLLSSIDLDELAGQALGAVADVGTQQGLPDRATQRIEGLAGPIASGIEGFIRDRIDRFVASDRFADLWETVNRESHAQLEAALAGNPDAVVIESGEISVQLAPIIDRVKERLEDDGLGLAARIPAVDTTITIYSGDDVASIQRAFDAINTAGVAIPIIAGILVVAGILLARDRRRATIRAGVGLAASMVVLALAILIGRSIYLDSLDSAGIPYEAATAIFDQVVSFLRLTLRAVLVVGLVIAVWATMSGPSAAAVRTRSAVTGAFGRWRAAADSRGWRLGGFGVWVHAHRRALRVAVPVLAALVLVFWPYPTGAVVLGLAVAAVLLILVVEFLGAAPQAAAEAPAASPD